jgi:aspergillopepsin I
MMWTLCPVLPALVAFLFTLLTSVTASPVVDKVNNGNTFSVPLVHNANRLRHGPSEVLKTLKKYNLDIPEGLQEVVDKHHAKTAILAAPDNGSSDKSSPTTSTMMCYNCDYTDWDRWWYFQYSRDSERW